MHKCRNAKMPKCQNAKILFDSLWTSMFGVPNDTSPFNIPCLFLDYVREGLTFIKRSTKPFFGAFKGLIFIQQNGRLSK